MSFDIYGDRAVEAMALIREVVHVEYWEYFKGDPERALEAFCVMQDAAEAKSAAKIADLEAQVSALKAAGGVPEGWQLVPKISTSKMDRAGEDAYEQNGHCDCGNANGCGMEAVFSAMLAAAPAAPQVAEQTKQQEPK